MKTADSNGLVFRRNKINFTYSVKVCETFWLGSQTWHALKTNHPSRGWLISVFENWVCTGCTLHWYIDRKLGDQRQTSIKLDQQYWKSKEVYPWTLCRTQSEEINNSAQHFAERFKEVPLQDTNKTKHQGGWQQARIFFCNLISDQMEQKPAFLNNIWFSDETCFHLSENVNKQTRWFWG